MRGVTAAVIGLLSLSVLAGCIGSEERLDAGGAVIPQAVLDGEEAPHWSVGHHWTYHTNLWDEITLVVMDDVEQEWWIGTSNEDLAWFHAREEVSFLERVRKDDLAGSQEGARVLYFDFPLTEGKSWTTSWGGTEDREITVVGTGDVFTLEGRDDGELAVVYTYDPVIGWFGGLTYYDEDGETSYVFELVDHGVDHTGTLVQWDITAQARVQGQSPADLAQAGLSVGTADDLWIDFSFVCTEAPTQYQFTVLQNTPVPQIVHDEIGACTTVARNLIIPDPAPGQWTLQLQYAGDPLADPAPSYMIEAIARTLETTTLQ